MCGVRVMSNEQSEGEVSESLRKVCPSITPGFQAPV